MHTSNFKIILLCIKQEKVIDESVVEALRCFHYKQTSHTFGNRPTLRKTTEWQAILRAISTDFFEF